MRCHLITELSRVFSPDCRRCSRLADFLDASRDRYPDYYCKPVPPFGDQNAHLLIVGLAPGLHGANATARPFTGDHAGILLYQTLFDCDFSSAPVSRAGDDLSLYDCRITNAVKCVPPQNKPMAKEVNTCNDFLRSELQGLPDSHVILALGGIAHKAVIRALGLRQADFGFGHNVLHELAAGQYLLDSYHCSRYNTQTRRLTDEMFQSVFVQARQLLKDEIQ
ncbi:MAG: uracil-DNA glycosylase [Gammaproteobacteria bacterium]|nr:uracil-DNA glycosylase [Gammaproteobacteria bacterium]